MTEPQKRRANVIYADGQPYYTLTSDDKLWLARMMVGEGADLEDRKAQLWTIAQRFVFRAKRYERTIVKLVQNFSQPVDPEWRRDGVFCRPGGEYAGTAHCSEAKLDRRERYATLTRSELREELELVEHWAKGHIPNPVPRAMDWHAWDLKEGYTRIGNYPNVFQAHPTAMRWPANKVEVGGPLPAPFPVKRISIALGLGALAAGGVYYASTQRSGFKRLGWWA